MSSPLYDLRVDTPPSWEKERFRMLCKGVELGWDCVAWNVNTHGKVTASSGGALKPVQDLALDVAQMRYALKQRALVVGEKPGLKSKGAQQTSSASAKAIRQISCLTVALDEVIDAQTLTLGNEVLRKFDIIAATPGNAKVFAFLCNTAEIDLIALDFTHKLSFSLNKKHIDTAVSRGISFEISYAGILGAQAHVRREIITGTKSLIQYLNGRNIVISSGAEACMQLRGGMDVANIAQIIGMRRRDALQVCRANGARVMKRALSRKLRYLPVEVVSEKDFLSRWPENSHVDRATMTQLAAAVVATAGKGGEGGDDEEDGDDATEVDRGEKRSIEEFRTDKDQASKKRKKNEDDDFLKFFNP